jgi:hypothetical protein
MIYSIDLLAQLLSRFGHGVQQKDIPKAATIAPFQGQFDPRKRKNSLLHGACETGYESVTCCD